jgi:hypothetical protein
MPLLPAGGLIADPYPRWTAAANKANKDQIQNGFKEINLTTEEQKELKEIKSLDQFLGVAKRLEGEHANKKGSESRDMIQENMANFQSLGKAFSPIVEAIPYGAGSMAWGLCSIVMTVRTLRHGIVEVDANE